MHDKHRDEQMSEEDEQLPWYREPWAWFVWLIPAGAVVSGLTMLAVAIATFDGLVVDDYYKQGKSINLVKQRDEAAKALGLTAELGVEGGGTRVSVTLSRPAEVGDSLELALSHATRSGLDRHVPLGREPTGRWSFAWPRPLEAGRWYLTLGNRDWRISGEVKAPLDAPVTLRLAPRETAL